MTMTIDISPETEARLDAEAASRGQAPDEYIRESFQAWLSLVVPEPDTEETLFQDMQALSRSTLEEYWLNDEDAVYDTL